MAAVTPHALLIPYPAQGHLNSLMHLAERLSSIGVLVTLVTTQFFYRSLHARPRCHKLRILSIKDGLEPDADRDLMRLHDSFQNGLEVAVWKLLQRVSLDEQMPRFSFVVGDFFLPWTRSLAHSFHLPEIIFWPLCAAAFAIYESLEQMTSATYNPFDNHVSGFTPKKPTDQLVTRIPGLPPIHPADLPFENKGAEPELGSLRALVNSRFRYIHEAAAVVGNSFEALESNVCAALNRRLHLVGPLISDSLVDQENRQVETPRPSLQMEEDCSEWLNAQPLSSVVYISFRSLKKLSDVNVKELAIGIAASQQRFLWLCGGKESSASKSCNIMNAFPEGFLDQIKDRGIIVNWAPQALVLSHAAVGGFFSHCGWNSTLESLCAGVPILGWPDRMDQMTNCWLVAKEWKIGMELKKDENNQVDWREVKESLRTLMEGPGAEEMRARVGKLKDAARKASRTHGLLKGILENVLRSS